MVEGVCAWGQWPVYQGSYCIVYNTLLHIPEAALKRRLMGVLEHPEAPWVCHCAQLNTTVIIPSVAVPETVDSRTVKEA